VLAGGFSGSAARVAGAAAAVGCEGYRLYNEVVENNRSLRDRIINEAQYQENFASSTVECSGRAMGGLAGAALGQAAIPVPVVGAVVGGVAGAVAGGAHSAALFKGMWRLSGGKAKADDQVRCIEHRPGLHSFDENEVSQPAVHDTTPLHPISNEGYRAPALSEVRMSPYGHIGPPPPSNGIGSTIHGNRSSATRTSYKQCRLGPRMRNDSLRIWIFNVDISGSTMPCSCAPHCQTSSLNSQA